MGLNRATSRDLPNTCCCYLPVPLSCLLCSLCLLISFRIWAAYDLRRRQRMRDIL